MPVLSESAELSTLPEPVQRVARVLAASEGVAAVVLGGSRAGRTADAGSDWDLAVYYRRTIDLGPLGGFGEVHPPGAWGRLMNGGAWLQVDGVAVDVLLRDLDVVEHWSTAAARGEYELDAILGYLAGLPTYTLLAELASGRTLLGHLPEAGPLPPALAAGAPLRWRFARDFSLEYARMHLQRGDLLAAVAQAAKAALEEAHARLCERGTWVLNEKRLLARAGLGELQAWLARSPGMGAAGEAWLSELADQLNFRG